MGIFMEAVSKQIFMQPSQKLGNQKKEKNHYQSHILTFIEHYINPISDETVPWKELLLNYYCWVSISAYNQYKELFTCIYFSTISDSNIIFPTILKLVFAHELLYVQLEHT